MIARPWGRRAAGAPARAPIRLADVGSENYLAAVQEALAGENAALWAAGVAAAVLTGSQRTAALKQLEDHRAARDELRKLLVAAGSIPTPAAPAYQLPFPVTGPKPAAKLMAQVSQALCPVYANLAAAAAPTQRRWPTRQCRANALRALDWGAKPAPFPGT